MGPGHQEGEPVTIFEAQGQTFSLFDIPPTRRRMAVKLL